MLGTSNPNVIYNFANLYNLTGDIKNAEKYYKIYNGLWPSHTEAHYKLGHLYINTDRFEEARREFQAILSLIPGHAQAQSYIDLIDKKTINK